MAILDKHLDAVPHEIKTKIEQVLKDMGFDITNKQLSLTKIKGLKTSDARYGISDWLRKKLFRYGDDCPFDRWCLIDEVAYQKYLFYKKDGNEEPNRRVIIEYVFTKVNNVKKWVFYRIFYTYNHYTDVYRVRGDGCTGEIKNL